jgi:hypothetical protein
MRHKLPFTSPLFAPFFLFKFHRQVGTNWGSKTAQYEHEINKRWKYYFLLLCLKSVYLQPE